MSRPTGTVFLATILLVSLGITESVKVQRECIASHGKKGFCVLLKECPEIDAVVGQHIIMEEQMKMLTAVSKACDSDIGTATTMVCCSAPSVLPKTCVLPGQNDDHTEGICVPVYDCMLWQGHFQRGFMSKKDYQRFQSAQESCRSQDSQDVCCAKESNIEGKEEFAPRCLQDRLEEANQHNGTYPSDSKFIAYIISTVIGGNRRDICSGSLITSEYVLTAAHCVQGHDQLDVYFGASNVYQYDPLYKNYYPDVDAADVSEQIIHENFNNFTYAYDIALLRLDDSINSINPVCIPTASEHYKVISENLTRVLFSYGWGSNIKGNVTSIKQQVTLQELPFEACLERRPENQNGTITKDLNICTDTISGHNTFSGYSGSPLMYRQKAVWFMVGLVSYRYDVNGKLSNRYPFVATSFGKSNQDWIVEQILSRS